MEGGRFSPEEISVIRTLFDHNDPDRTGKIHINQIPGLLTKLGKNEDEVVNITSATTKVAEENDGQIKFDDFLAVLEQLDNTAVAPFEGPDPKVIEFLRILEEYRVKCEEEGNYLEAGRAHKQLQVLRKQEEKRQQKAVRARQIAERQDVQLAHNMQFSDFNAAWDKYMEEYDNMAQMYIQQMTERHAVVLLEYQKQLRQELLAKPPKWSRELLEMRRKQHVCARNKNYSEAQKLKKICDKIEENERREMESSHAVNFAKKEAKFRQQQQAELQALLKRIECRRKEHIKQRNLDSKRLLQRNRNVQAVLESKQVVESQKLFSEIKKNLHQGAYVLPGNAAAAGPGGGGANRPVSNGPPGSGSGKGPKPDSRNSAGNVGVGAGGYDKDTMGYFADRGNETTFVSDLDMQQQQRQRGAHHSSEGDEEEEEEEEDGEGGGFGRTDDDISFNPPFMGNGSPALPMLGGNRNDGLF